MEIQKKVFANRSSVHGPYNLSTNNDHWIVIFDHFQPSCHLHFLTLSTYFWIRIRIIEELDWTKIEKALQTLWHWKHFSTNWELRLTTFKSDTRQKVQMVTTFASFDFNCAEGPEEFTYLTTAISATERRTTCFDRLCDRERSWLSRCPVQPSN